MTPNTQAKICACCRSTSSNGSAAPDHQVDVRLIAATNRDCHRWSSRRLPRDSTIAHVVTIEMPPLRERKEDIAPLANFFIRRFAGELKKRIEGLDADA